MDSAPRTDNYFQLSSQRNFLVNVGVCGVCYYLYNEMQNVVLGSLGAVSTAVANTLKRVVILYALFVAFPETEKFPEAKVIGCVLAVVGCLLYSIFDGKKI